MHALTRSSKHASQRLFSLHCFDYSAAAVALVSLRRPSTSSWCISDGLLLSKLHTVAQVRTAMSAGVQRAMMADECQMHEHVDVTLHACIRFLRERFGHLAALQQQLMRWVYRCLSSSETHPCICWTAALAPSARGGPGSSVIAYYSAFIWCKEPEVDACNGFDSLGAPVSHDLHHWESWPPRAAVSFLCRAAISTLCSTPHAVMQAKHGWLG